MNAMKTYLLTLPERIVRSIVGLGAGVAREVGEVALPDGVRQGRLYQNLVDTTLRFLIEQVGGVEGTYPSGTLPGDFLARRTAGNAIEALGIVAFRASPVWVLAAMADVCGLGRHLIPQIADELRGQGLLEPGTRFETVDQLLDGLERTSSRVAETINTPPLDVASLRRDWQAIREEARSLQPTGLPSAEIVTGMWERLRAEAAAQNTTVFQASSMLAVSVVRSAPDGFRWMANTAVAGTQRVGSVLGSALLDHYRATLDEVREAGFTEYTARQLGPYVKAAVAQFSPEQRTVTERLVDRIQPKA